jgi:hypothetical protein
MVTRTTVNELPMEGCGRRFVQGFDHYLISAEERALIEHLLVEWISCRGMGRAVEVGLNGLLAFSTNALMPCMSILRSNPSP